MKQKEPLKASTGSPLHPADVLILFFWEALSHLRSQVNLPLWSGTSPTSPWNLEKIRHGMWSESRISLDFSELDRSSSLGQIVFLPSKLQPLEPCVPSHQFGAVIGLLEYVSAMRDLNQSGKYKLFFCESSLSIQETRGMDGEFNLEKKKITKNV